MAKLIFDVFLVILLNVTIAVSGYVSLKIKAGWLGWIILIAGLSLIHFYFINESATFRMIAILASTFPCVKILAAHREYNKSVFDLNFRQWLAYSLGWVGMRAGIFKSYPAKSLGDEKPLIRFGLSRIGLGLLLICISHVFVRSGLSNGIKHVLVSCLLLVAYSLILHFGLLSISTGQWRSRGVNTNLLFKSPLKSTSLSEFWSRRWNLAFVEMSSFVIYRPIKPYAGEAMALIASFVFSGILHELALSLPVTTGYGLPMLFFTIQALLILVEKLFEKKNIKFLQNKFAGRAWTFSWLIITAPLLFHPAFLQKIIWPMAGLSYLI